MDGNQKTAAELAAEIRAVEDMLPRPMRNPAGVVRIVAACNHTERLARGWTFATEDRRPAA